MVYSRDRRCFSAVRDDLVQAVLAEVLRVLLNDGLESDYSWRLLWPGLLFLVDG